MWILTALGAAVLWGLNYSLNERIFQGRIAPVTLLSLQALVGSVVFLAFGARSGVLREDLARLQFDTRTAAVVALCLVTGVAANYLISLSIQSRNATVAGLIELSYPVFTVAFTWLLFGQSHLSPAIVGGGLLIVAGALLIGLAPS